MVFRFEHAEWGVDDNVRRAARNEFDSAIAEVAETGFEIHSTIRDVRRRLKRVRAILRLVRPVFPDYAEENAALRDTGAEFGDLRDAMALVEAVDLVGERARDDEEGAVQRVRAALSRRAADSDSSLDREAFLTDLRAKLREARVRSELWELAETGRKAMVPGLVDAYRRARRAFAEARADGSLELLHEFRKHVKYHLAHLRLLQDLAPLFADERRRQMQKLARRLGNIQNLHVLDAALAAEPDGIGSEDNAVVRGLVDRQLLSLRGKALAAGARLFREPPRVIETRWSVYWADWQEAQKLAAS